MSSTSPEFQYWTRARQYCCAHVVEQLDIKQSAAIWVRNTIKKMSNDSQLPVDRAFACTQHLLGLVAKTEFESRVVDQLSLCLPPLMTPSGCFDHDGSASTTFFQLLR